MNKTICELFAGVGGFRLAFEKLNSGWDTVWFNQFEPKFKRQFAHDCYIKHFGECKDLEGNITTNIDINDIDKSKIPNHTLLVAGFPCQDYSVANSQSKTEGIKGKKGVLWWQIYETLLHKHPKFCLFENVDRLLKSPSNQRGRDFGIMLKCLNSLNYSVEWRVIDASNYGAYQKRKRVFIFAYKNDSYHGLTRNKQDIMTLISYSLFNKTFPISKHTSIKTTNLFDSLENISDNFSFEFSNFGIMEQGLIFTTNVTDLEEDIKPMKEILEYNIHDKYLIKDDKIDKWKYLKGSKKINRISKSGHSYIYSEGAVPFPDNINKPSRTILTSESNINRTSHVIEDPSMKKLRVLTPIEVERLQGFDDNWTNTGMSEKMRYFTMGNALVVPIVTKIAKSINEIIDYRGGKDNV